MAVRRTIILLRASSLLPAGSLLVAALLLAGLFGFAIPVAGMLRAGATPPVAQQSSDRAFAGTGPADDSDRSFEAPRRMVGWQAHDRHLQGFAMGGDAGAPAPTD